MRHMQSPATLRQELWSGEFQAWLRHLERWGPSTNMELEGLLAEIKASCRPPTAKGSNAEKFAYLGLLTQLMHRHLAAGRPDCRKTSYQDLKESGMPLDVPRSEPGRARSGRPDTAYIMSGLHRFIREHPGCSLEEQGAERRRLHAEWVAMGPDGQQAHMASTKQPGGVVSKDEGEQQEVPPSLAGHFFAPSWESGSWDWPVSPQALRLLQESCPTAHADGLANKMQQVRWDGMGSLLLQDQGLIQSDEVFCHRFSCWEKHPGLCSTKHAAIYHESKQLASLLEIFFVADHLLGFFRIQPDQAFRPEASTRYFDPSIVVFFAHKRQRRFHAQVTHVFIRCTFLTDGAYAFHQQKAMSLGYLNVWMLARLLIETYGEVQLDEYHVQRLRHIDKLENPDGSFALLGVVAPESLVRPPRQRTPRAVSELDRVKDRAKLPQRPKPPKVRRVAPVPSTGLPVDEVHEVPSDDDDDDDCETDAGTDDDPPDRPVGQPGRGGGRPIPVPGAMFAPPGDTACPRERFEDLRDAPPSVLAAILGKRNTEPGGMAASSGGAASSGEAPAVGSAAVAVAAPLASGMAASSGGVASSGEAPTAGSLAVALAAPPAGGLAASSGGVASSGEAPAVGSLAVAVAAPPGPPVVPRARNEVRSQVGTGFILLNVKGESLDAHCHICNCAVNRKFTPFSRARSARKRAQGRPMGMLTAFLHLECNGDPAQHRNMIPTLTHSDRVRARMAARAAGESNELFARERDVNSCDEDDEPLELP